MRHLVNGQNFLSLTQFLRDSQLIIAARPTNWRSASHPGTMLSNVPRFL